MSLPLLVASWRGEAAARSVEPQFPDEMRLCLKNHQRMEDEGVSAMDLFTPNGRVSEAHQYGVRVYQTYACVTEAEYMQLVQYNPGEIKTKKPFTLPIQGPLQNMQLWLLDLRDIEPSVAQALRKVDIYYTTKAELEQVFLHPEQQIEKKQPWTVFRRRCSKHFDKRPDPLRPAAKRPDTVASLVEAHLIEKSKRAQQVSAAAAMGAVQDQGDDAAAAREVPQRKLGLDDDEDEEDGSKPRRRRATAKKAAIAMPAMPSRTIAESALAAHPADALLSSRAPSPIRSLSGTGKKGKKPAMEEEFKDLDMKEVADAHLSTSTGSSVKSLITLSDPLSFLIPTNDANSCMKVQTNALSAVGSSAVRSVSLFNLLLSGLKNIWRCSVSTAKVRLFNMLAT